MFYPKRLFLISIPRLDVLRPVHVRAEAVHQAEMPSWILDVILHILPPRPVAVAAPRHRRDGARRPLQVIARYRRRYDALGGHRLDSQYLRHLRAGKYPPEGVGRAPEPLPLDVRRPLLGRRRRRRRRRSVAAGVAPPLEATVLDLAELIGVHPCVLGYFVHLLHARGAEGACAAVHERSVVRVLACLAVVVDEFELILAWLVFTDDIPVFPEF